MKTNNKNNNNNKAPQKKEEEKVEDEIYEGERLARFLNAIQKQVQPAAQLSSLPDKFWYKQQFAVGVNEVTRALERMPPPSAGFPDSHRLPPRGTSAAAARRKPTPLKLQAVLVAWDCNPKWLTKHIPGLASSRKVPVVFVKDNKGGSLRLGELVKLRTAIAVGVKDRGSSINQAIAELLGDSGIPAIEPETAAS